MELDLELLGTRIKSARKLRRRTLDDVADAIGVNKSTVQRYEVGKIAHPKLPVIKSVAEYLDVSHRWLIGETEDMDPVSDELEKLLKMLENRAELRALLKTADHADPREVQAVMDFFTALRNRE